MKPVELKVGYVLEILNDEDVSFVMVLPSVTDDLVVSGPAEWFPLRCLNDNLEYMDCKVMKVYGLSTNQYAHQLSEECRELLWTRREVSKLTKSQIEELLGYPIEIVEEDKDGEL